MNNVCFCPLCQQDEGLGGNKGVDAVLCFTLITKMFLILILFRIKPTLGFFFLPSHSSTSLSSDLTRLLHTLSFTHILVSVKILKTLVEETIITSTASLFHLEKSQHILAGKCHRRSCRRQLNSTSTIYPSRRLRLFTTFKIYP